MKNLLFIIISSIFLLGCNNNSKEIKVYEIYHHNRAKAPAPQMAHGPHDGHDHEGHNHAETKPAKSTPTKLSWKAPIGWVEQAGNSIRLVTFKISDKAECSLIVLGGQAGGLADNVNRWRRQIGLSPIALSAIENSMVLVKTPLAEAKMFKLVNPNSKGQAFLVSLLPKDNGTLFVKLMAPANMIDSLEKPYLELLTSISASE
ncbi:hypothetical protein MJH12_14130 [bacterium]|nr:hypothetical protein [bacterium]